MTTIFIHRPQVIKLTNETLKAVIFYKIAH